MARRRPDTVRRPRGATRRSGSLKDAGDGRGPGARAQKRWDDEPHLHAARSWPTSRRRCRPTPSWWTRRSRRAPISPARSPSSEPGDYFGARGGGIGQALPGALGVKVARPDRPVVAISGDGSSMYSIQALWTAAHHDLAVVFVILDNREYRILKHNMDVYRQRFGVQVGRPYVHMDLAKPDLPSSTSPAGWAWPARASRARRAGPALDAALGSAALSARRDRRGHAGHLDQSC